MFQVLEGGDEITLPKLVKSDDIKHPKNRHLWYKNGKKNGKYS